MAPKDAVWKPQLVTPPEDPKGRTCFDWNDDKLKEWRDNAVKMQEAHVKDNSRTEWFAYTPQQRDAIELRILMTIHGLRTPKGKGVPSCPLQTYTREERLDARKLKKKIVKHSGNPENIHFNVIYISTATKPEGEETFYASEEPVFVVRGSRKYIDKDGTIYDDFEDYKKNNKLPKGPTIAPKDGTYTPQPNGHNKVELESGETPAASFLKRVKVVTDTAAMLGGMILSVAGVVTFFAPALFSATTMAVIQAGSFILTGYSLGGAVLSIGNKTGSDESIRTEIFILISAAISAYTGKIRADVSKLARAGKTYTEAMQQIGRAHRTIFVIANVFTVVSSLSSIASVIIDMMQKRECSWLDYYHLCMGLFMFVNVLTKPITIKRVFESEQMYHMNRMLKELGSEEAKQSMSTMMAEHSGSSDERAYLIRNLNQIEDRTEFFELIQKTNSTVKCTADGLTINDKIDQLSPQAYNEIGRAAFQGKVNQLENSKESITEKNISKQFRQSVPAAQREEFDRRLQEMENLPLDQRKQATRQLLAEMNGAGNLNNEAFERKWAQVEAGYNGDIDKQVKKALTDLRAGGTQPEPEEDPTRVATLERRETDGIITEDERKELNKRRDFTRVKQLEIKKLNGTITDTEQQERDQRLHRYYQDRKEHFFQSSANHRTDANYDQTMDSLEKNVAGGSNLEEWKKINRDLEQAHNDQTITDAKYQAEKQRVEDGMAKANRFREYRDRADEYMKAENLNGTGAQLQERFVADCQTALTEAENAGDPVAIAGAREKLEMAREINTPRNANVIDSNRAFKDSIESFTSAKNERLCYRIQVDEVKSTLQHIYEQPNIEDISINGKRIFANMEIGGYDRLCRVFDTYGSSTNQIMNAATTVAQDPAISPLVNSVHDVASLTEAVKTSIDRQSTGVDKTVYLNNLVSGEGNDYTGFRDALRDRINAVNNLADSIKSQWSSPLTMAYHWWKHERDFGRTPLTIEQYFVDYANDLFKTENLTGISHSQTGSIKHTYLRSFGKRPHIGFTMGDNNTRLTHF